MVILIFFAYSEFDSRIEEIQKNKTEILKLEKRKLENRLEATISDVSLLIQFHKIADTVYRLSGVDPFHWRGLQLMSSAKPVYFQIRYIDSTGQEQIRIKDNIIVEKSQLQNKRDRYYFREAINLEKDKIFISALDLNVEDGKIETPYKPTLRFATPLYARDKTLGIIVINFAAKSLLQDLNNAVENKNTQFLLIDDEGYYLDHPDPFKEWGFILKDRAGHILQKEFPKAWNAMEENTSGNFFAADEGIFSFQPFHFPVITENGLYQLFSPSGLQSEKYRTWTLISRTPVWYVNSLKERIFVRFGAFFIIILIIAAIYSYESTSSQIRKKQEAQLKQERLDFVRQIIEGLPHPLFFANEKMECVISNFAFSEYIKAYPHAESFFGKNTSCKSLGIQQQIEEVMEQKETITFEKQENHDGVRKDYFYKLAPVRLSDETGVVGVVTDISDLKATERNLLATQKELKEINESKDKFFSIIAHDLKSPFNSILGFVDILETEFDEMNNQEKKEIIQNINYSSRKTFRLLEDILQWSRIQLGRMNIEPELINIITICKEIRDLYRNTLDAKNIHFYLLYDKEISLMADRYMITTVFRNLLSNAIKFTPHKGKITIRCKEQNKQVIITFEDTGVGMSREKTEDLFRVDKNVSTKGTDNESGTGLGLVLVKEFLEKNNGSIDVTSKKGEGSVFRLTFQKD